MHTIVEKWWIQQKTQEKCQKRKAWKLINYLKIWINSEAMFKLSKYSIRERFKRSEQKLRRRKLFKKKKRKIKWMSTQEDFLMLFRTNLIKKLKLLSAIIIFYLKNLNLFEMNALPNISEMQRKKWWIEWVVSDIRGIQWTWEFIWSKNCRKRWRD